MLLEAIIKSSVARKEEEETKRRKRRAEEEEEEELVALRVCVRVDFRHAQVNRKREERMGAFAHDIRHTIPLSSADGNRKLSITW